MAFLYMPPLITPAFKVPYIFASLAPETMRQQQEAAGNPSLNDVDSVEGPLLASESPAQFTPFPKMPIEIRLNIWRWTFPRGREVNFGNELVFKAMTAKLRANSVTFDHGEPLPVALRVNKESRAETSKHYSIVFRGDCQSYWSVATY